MVPNGTGKITLSKVILGNKNNKLVSGKILFDDQDIAMLTTDETTRFGMFLSMQNPISIKGVLDIEFFKIAID